MQCNYLTKGCYVASSPLPNHPEPKREPLPKKCTAGPGNYTPNTNENAKYCNTMEFQKCPRFEASIIIGKNKK